MQPVIYSNGSQECERAESLLNSVQFNECNNVKVFHLNEDFTIKQFKAEFGERAEFPQIAIGLNHRGTLKETIHYMSSKGMFL
jgi:glutaredoxin|tara:strand:- start:865 stop:1113 length:249 start_codon:yes stop_codon:yes gene_type:complete